MRRTTVAKKRNTITNPWKPGDNITIRLRQTDGDVIDYLNDPNRSTTDEILNALQLKMKIEQMEASTDEVLSALHLKREIEQIEEGHPLVKPDQLFLLEEINRTVQSHMETMESRMMEKLTDAIKSSSSRDNELAASKETVEDEDLDEDAIKAMQDLGAF